MKINAFNIIHAISGRFAGKTFQLKKDGSNICFIRKYFPGLPNMAVEAMIARYNSLSNEELLKWDKISKDNKFHSRYQAFASSFFLYVSKYGLARALVDPIPFMFSKSRIEKMKRFMWLVSQRMGEAETLSDKQRGFGTKTFGVGGFGSKRKDKINMSMDTLKKYGKELSYFFILPEMKSEQDISEASVLNLIKLKGGFGTGTYGSGTFGTKKTI